MLLISFHDDHGLAHAGAAERADLAALGEGADQVDDLNAGLEDLRAGVLVLQAGGLAVDGIALLELDRAALVGGLAENVEDAAEDAFADRHGDRAARVVDFVAALEAFRERHGNGADPAVAKVLLDFEGKLGGLATEVVVDGEGIVKGGHVAVGELDVDDGADDLDDLAGLGGGRRGGGGGGGCHDGIFLSYAVSKSEIGVIAGLLGRGGGVGRRVEAGGG